MYTHMYTHSSSEHHERGGLNSCFTSLDHGACLSFTICRPHTRNKTLQENHPHSYTNGGKTDATIMDKPHTHTQRHAKVELIKKERKCVCLCVCLYFFMWPRGRPFSMLSFQLLLDELFWSSGPLHSQLGLSEVCPTTHKHTPTD